jgi:hypothetical protein
MIDVETSRTQNPLMICSRKMGCSERISHGHYLFASGPSREEISWKTPHSELSVSFVGSGHCRVGLFRQPRWRTMSVPRSAGTTRQITNGRSIRGYCSRCDGGQERSWRERTGKGEQTMKTLMVRRVLRVPESILKRSDATRALLSRRAGFAIEARLHSSRGRARWLALLLEGARLVLCR